jgi:hypothetical protein
VGATETLPAFAIPRSRMSVVVGALGLIACLGFAFLIGLFGILPFFEPEFAHVSHPARFAALAVAAAIGSLGIWILRRSVGASRGEVRVDGDNLVIEHPDTFKAPLAVPREAIRVAVVDKQGEGRLGEEERISKIGDEQLGWAALPFLSSHESLDAPNVGLLFREPVAGPAVRHVGQPRSVVGPTPAMARPGGEELLAHGSRLPGLSLAPRTVRERRPAPDLPPPAGGLVLLAASAAPSYLAFLIR